jgi:cytoskeletal protein CcmA (bactofilin family)
MRTKEEEESGAAPRVVSDSKPSTRAAAPQRREASGPSASIGQSIQIDGTLTGNEDLTIDGKVKGKIELRGHVLTIGSNGAIQADLRAKTVVIHGDVAGNVSADDKVQVASSGSLQGNIRAPRVALEDGCRFKGTVDMGESQPATSSRPANASTDAKSEAPRAARAAS